MTADNHQPGRQEQEPRTATIKGNLGADPIFQTITSHKDPNNPQTYFQTKFSVGVNQPDGKTVIWYEVSAIEKLAHSIQDNLKLGKGTLVEVTGKEIVKEVPAKDGGIHTIHELRLQKLPTIIAQPNARRGNSPSGEE